MKNLNQFKVEEISKQQAHGTNGGSDIHQAVVGAIKAANDLIEFMKNPPAV